METQNIAQTKELITFEDFVKADIRICEVTALEKVAGKDRLYKLEIDTGFEKRTVVSAIAHKLTPEQVLGKKFPFVLNLQPRPIANIESRGMIMLAEGKDGTYFVPGDENTEVGAKVI